MNINWKTYKLGELIDRIIDNRGKSAPISEDRYQPIIEINSLGGKSPNYELIRKWVSKDTYDNWFRSGHPIVGDILIPTVGTIGIASIMNENRGCIAQNIIALRTNNKANNLFLYYYLKSESVKQQLLNLNIGGVQPSIKVPHLLNLDILLPSLEEQRRIAGILGAIDDKIECNRRINANLELQAQALYKQWFVDFEFPNENGKPYKSSGGKMADSELGPIPEGWRVQTFGDLIKPQKGKNITRAQVTIGSVPVVAGGLMPSCYHNTSNTHCPVVTISASGANAGYVKMYHMPIWAADCSYIDDTISKYVHFAYVFLTYNQTFIYHKQQGCAQPHIYPSHLMELQFICPTLDILDKFESWSKKIYKLIGTNIQEIETLATLRDTLLPKLMNGEIKL